MKPRLLAREAEGFVDLLKQPQQSCAPEVTRDFEVRLGLGQGVKIACLKQAGFKQYTGDRVVRVNGVAPENNQVST